VQAGSRKNGETAGTSSAADVDVAALFQQLQEEVSRTGPRRAAGDAPSTARLNARAAAERLWRVTADRPTGGRGGAAGAAMRPVKLAVRRLTRWYVEPVFADQRAFNNAALKLIDDLQQQVEALQERIAELERARTPS
jgi:hypothetical protein